MKKLLLSILLITCALFSYGQQQFDYQGHSTSVSDTYTVSLTNVTTYETATTPPRGIGFSIIFDTSSSGACTLNVNGLGAITINGDITADVVYRLEYNVVTDQFDMISGGGGGGDVSSVFGRTGDVVAVSGDYNATEVSFTPGGGLAADDVDEALDELDTDKQPNIAFGTGVEAALGNNIGSGGAPVLFNGAGGTPSSLTGTNITGTASGLTAGGNLPLSLSGATVVTGSSSNTLRLSFPSLGITQTNGAGIWLSNQTAAAAANQQISPSAIFEGQGWKTTATAASQSVKMAIDLLPVQGTTAPSGQLRFKSSIDGAAYSNSIMDVWTDGRVSIGTSTPQSSTTLTVDRFGGSNNNIVNFLASSTSVWRISATGNVVHTANNAVTVGGTQIYSLAGTYSASSGNPETIGIGSWI
jgi:hypothetical protein